MPLGTTLLTFGKSCRLMCLKRNCSSWSKSLTQQIVEDHCILERQYSHCSNGTSMCLKRTCITWSKNLLPRTAILTLSSMNLNNLSCSLLCQMEGSCYIDAIGKIKGVLESQIRVFLHPYRLVQFPLSVKVTSSKSFSLAEVESELAKLREPGFCDKVKRSASTCRSAWCGSIIWGNKENRKA